MKKVISVLLAVLLAATLFACSSKNDADLPATEKANETAASESAGDSAINVDIETVSAASHVIELETMAPFTFEIETVTMSSNVIHFEMATLKPFSIDWYVDAGDSDKVDDLSDEQIARITETKDDLLKKLREAFKKEGIDANVDAASGEVMLDSSVLFGGDSAVLSDTGKDFLKKFIRAYSSVVLDSAFDGFISKVVVEGHTAPVAGDTYESDLPLSEKRAENVKSFCLSADAGISAAALSALKPMMEAVGMSNARPVLKDDGSVDMDASRRVSFRFMINFDNA
ncbi:MAG: OmpA family protein [Clostridia bacterium]|nr:OmpA family protein [Clostridia bacterium]